MDGEVSDMALSPDGRSLYVTMTYADSTTFDMEVVDTGTDSASTLLGLGGSGETVSVNPTGRYAYVTFSTDSGTWALATIDLARRSIVNTMPIAGSPGVSAITPNGRFLYISTDPYTTASPSGQKNFDGQLIVVDTTEHRVVATFGDGRGLACGLAVAPEGSEVLESFCSSEGTQVPPLPIRVYGTGTNALLATIPTRNGATGLAFSPDGRTVYAATNEDNIDVINPRSNGVTGSISVPTQGALQTLGPLTTSPSGNVLYVGTGFLPPFALLVVPVSQAPGG